MLLAYAVAVVHAAVLALVMTGAVVALWWPRILWAHLPVGLASVAVNGADLPCPLTQLELWLRAEAGGALYQTGYLMHYIFEPMGFDAQSRSLQWAVYAALLVPNALEFGVFVLGAVRRRSGSSVVAT